MRSPAGTAVEPLNGKRPAFHAPGLFGQAVDFSYVHQPVVRDVDADGARQFQHDVFVFRDGGKAGRGQLDDPGPAHAVGRNGQSAGRLHHGGKLQLHAGQ